MYTNIETRFGLANTAALFAGSRSNTLVERWAAVCQDHRMPAAIQMKGQKTDSPGIGNLP